MQFLRLVVPRRVSIVNWRLFASWPSVTLNFTIGRRPRPDRAPQTTPASVARTVIPPVLPGQTRLILHRFPAAGAIAHVQSSRETPRERSAGELPRFADRTPPRVFAARIREQMLVRREWREAAVGLTMRRAWVTDEAPIVTRRSAAVPFDDRASEGRPWTPTAPPSPSRRVASPRDWDTVREAPWLAGRAQGSMNLEALTDHVLRQLDNRMIASRERMGKV